MNEKIIDFFLVITVFSMVMFALFLLTQKSTKRTSNRLLAGFLLCNATPLAFYLFVRLNPHLAQNFPMIFGWAYIFDFLMGPLIYFYTLAVAFKDFLFKKSDLVHLIVPASFILYLPFRYFYIAWLSKTALPSDTNFFQIEQLILDVFVHSLMIAYGIFSDRLLNRYSREI